MSEIAAGTKLPTFEQQASLHTSVAYAGASGDLNPLHFDESFASQVSPTGGIIAHGMYTMGLASRLLTEFAGGPENVLEIAVRFRRPWPLGSTTTFGGEVKEVEDGVATVALWARTEDGDDLIRATGRIQAT